MIALHHIFSIFTENIVALNDRSRTHTIYTLPSFYFDTSGHQIRLSLMSTKITVLRNQ